MLRRLVLEHVGPAARLELTPVAERFNLIAGDNGLGKSFLLDAAWWALTRTWHGTPALPHAPDASIGYTFDAETGLHRDTARWDAAAQSWKRKAGRPPNPALVLYARVDGSFSVWDPARNYRSYRRADGGEAESPAAYQFAPNDVLWGLRRSANDGGAAREQVLCKGLVEDWVDWQSRGDERFRLLEAMLARLGPESEPLAPGAPERPTLDDVREIPTIRMPYGQAVPLTHAAAGIRRMASLAYLLAWAFSEHRLASARLGGAPSSQVVLLMDEPETHLHPRWQRTVLTSLASAVEQQGVQVQVIAATHAPLVLASMEPIFDPARDALWVLDLTASGSVELKRGSWVRRGDASAWLVSDVFDLREARSLPAEQALQAALKLLRERAPDSERVREVHAQLGAVLGDTDRFWLRWSEFAHRHGVAT